jgi:hypothetical protein
MGHRVPQGGGELRQRLLAGPAREVLDVGPADLAGEVVLLFFWQE